MLGNVVSRKCVVLWTVGKASSSMNKVTVTLEHGRMTQEWGTFSLGRETLSLGRLQV